MTELPTLRFEPDASGRYHQRRIVLRGWRLEEGQRVEEVELEDAYARSPEVPDAFDACDFEQREDGTLQGWLSVSESFQNHSRFDVLTKDPIEVTVTVERKPAEDGTRPEPIEGHFLVEIDSRPRVEIWRPQEGLADLRQLHDTTIEVTLRVTRGGGKPIEGLPVRWLVPPDEDPSLPGTFEPSEGTTDEGGLVEFTYTVQGLRIRDDKAPSVTFEVRSNDDDPDKGPGGLTIGRVTLVAAPPVMVKIEKFGFEEDADFRDPIEYPPELAVGGSLVIRPMALLEVRGRRFRSEEPLRHAKVRVAGESADDPGLEWSDAHDGYVFRFEPDPAGGGPAQLVSTTPDAEHRVDVDVRLDTDVAGEGYLVEALGDVLAFATRLEGATYLARPLRSQKGPLAEAFVQALVDLYAEETEDALEEGLENHAQCALRARRFLRHTVDAYDAFETSLVLHRRSYESFLRNWISFGVEVFFGMFLDAAVAYSKAVVVRPAKEAYEEGLGTALRSAGKRLKEGAEAVPGRSMDVVDSIFRRLKSLKDRAVGRIASQLTAQRDAVARELAELPAGPVLREATDNARRAAMDASDRLEQAAKNLEDARTRAADAEALSRELDELDAGIPTREAEVQGLRDEIEAEAATARQLREQAEELESAHARELSELSERAESAARRLDEEIPAERARLAADEAELEPELTQARTGHAEAEQAARETESALSGNRGRQRNQQLDIDAGNRRVDNDLEPRRAELEARRAEVEGELPDASRRAERTASMVEKLEGDLEAAANTAERRLAQVDEARSALPEDSPSRAALDDAERTAREDLVAEQQRIGERLEIARRHEQEARGALEDLEARERQLAGERDAAAAEVGRARGEITRMEQELERLRDVERGLERRATEQAETVGQAASRRDAAESARTELDARREALDAETTELGAARARDDARLAELRAEAEAARADAERLRERAEATDEGADARRTAELEPVEADLREMRRRRSEAAGSLEAEPAPTAAELRAAEQEVPRLSRETREKARLWAEATMGEAEKNAKRAELSAAREALDGTLQRVQEVRARVPEGLEPADLERLHGELTGAAEHVERGTREAFERGRDEMLERLRNDEMLWERFGERLRAVPLKEEWDEFWAETDHLSRRLAAVREKPGWPSVLEKLTLPGLQDDMAEDYTKGGIAGDADALRRIGRDAERFRGVKYADDWTGLILWGIDGVASVISGIVKFVLDAGYWFMWVITFSLFDDILDAVKWLLSHLLAFMFRGVYFVIRSVAQWAKRVWLAGPEHLHDDEDVTRAKRILEGVRGFSPEFFFDPQRSALDHVLDAVVYPGQYFKPGDKRANESNLLKKFGGVYDRYYDVQRQHARNTFSTLTGSALEGGNWRRANWSSLRNYDVDLGAIVHEAHEYDNAFEAANDQRFSSSGVRIFRGIFTGTDGTQLTWQDIDQIADWLVFVLANGARVIGIAVGLGFAPATFGTSLAVTAGLVVGAEVLDKAGAFLRTAVLSLLVHNRVIGIQEDLVFAEAIEHDELYREEEPG